LVEKIGIVSQTSEVSKTIFVGVQTLRFGLFALKSNTSKSEGLDSNARRYGGDTGAWEPENFLTHFSPAQEIRFFEKIGFLLELKNVKRFI
jgi:hypothetical protein